MGLDNLKKAFIGTAAAVGISSAALTGAAQADDVTCVEGAKAQISQSEKVRRGLIEERELNSTPGYPMQFYSNARGHANWWSDQCGNDDTIMIPIKLAANPPAGAVEGLHQQLVDYVRNDLKFSDFEIFYQNTDRQSTILRTAYEGQLSRVHFMNEAKDALARSVELARSDMAVEGKTLEELEQVVSLNTIEPASR